MDFDLTEEQQTLRLLIREISKKELTPIAAQLDEEDKIPDDTIKKLGEIGIFGIPFPARYGGAERGYVELTLTITEIARISASVAMSVGSNYLAAIPINKFGNDEQKEKYLLPLCQGKAIGSFAFTEPGTGSDPKAISTLAKLVGKEYILNGRKRFITNATSDGIIVIFARDGERISAFIAEKNIDGYKTSKPWKKMGMHGVLLTDIYIDNMRIPASNLLGSSGNGYTILLDTIAINKLNVSATLLGAAQAALDEAIEYAKGRTVRGRPISDFQIIQSLIADIAIQLEAATWLIFRLATLIDQGKDIRTESAKTKVFVSEMAVEAARKALQIHGSYGYVRESVIERIYRDVKLGEIIEGTTEIQKMIIASNLLRS
jgi:alkylation response protein AidB-like acyl-CoA dehydrogenase